MERSKRSVQDYDAMWETDVYQNHETSLQGVYTFPLLLLLDGVAFL